MSYADDAEKTTLPAPIAARTTTAAPNTARTAAAGLALVVGLTASPALATAPPAPAPAPGAAVTTAAAEGLDRYYHQRPAWGTCVRSPHDETGRELDKAGVHCAAVTVPLDYAAPGGRTITVALSRLKATDTRRRIGAILLNNGGPGGPAVDSPPVVRKAMKEVGPRYDIVGFDPRFVGRSTPLDCGWPVGFT